MKTEQEYGPPPGMETMDERRLRMAREQEEREKKLKEMKEEQRKNSKVDRKYLEMSYLSLAGQIRRVSTDILHEDCRDL